MKKHNGIISFWKFIFCIIIMFYHIRYKFLDSGLVLFKKGGIAVEFFFIVSGFLLAKSAFKNNSKDNDVPILEDTFHFISRKFKALFPYVLIAFIIDITLKGVIKNLNVSDYYTSIFDLTLLTMFGFRSRRKVILGQGWYISAMLISMALIYPQMKKFKKNYFYYIAPLSALFIGGFLFYKYGGLLSPFTWSGLVYKGLLRAYMELSIGAIIYFICEKIKKINFTKFGAFILTFIELFGFIFIVIFLNFQFKDVYDFLVLIGLGISILLAFSEKTLEYNICNNNLFYFLERLSLPFYLIHQPIYEFVNNYINVYHIEVLAVFSISLVLSCLAIILVDYLKSKNYFMPSIKKLFIVQ